MHAAAHEGILCWPWATPNNRGPRTAAGQTAQHCKQLQSILWRLHLIRASKTGAVAGCTTLGMVTSAVFLAQYCKHLPIAVALPETTTVLQEDRGTLWESQIVQDMVQSAIYMIVYKMLT